MHFRDRIRVFVLRLNDLERIVIAAAHQVDRAGRPGAHHGGLQVQPAATIDDGQRAPRAVMARREDTNEQFGAGNRPGIEHGTWRVGVVSPIDRVIGAVGVHGPGALGVAEIAIDVFPPVVEDSSVGQEHGMSLVQRAMTDLLDVGSVGIHGVQVAHDMPVAHAVLRLTRGGEADPAVGQVDWVDVGKPLSERQLSQAGPSAFIS